MKNRLNITIDDSLIEKAKLYAAENNKSLSELVEDYLEKMVLKPKPKQQTFLEYTNSLPRPKGRVPAGDLRKALYERRKKKYGF
jgi:hypothetical protein